MAARPVGFMILASVILANAFTTSPDCGGMSRLSNNRVKGRPSLRSRVTTAVKSASYRTNSSISQKPLDLWMSRRFCSSNCNVYTTTSPIARAFMQLGAGFYCTKCLILPCVSITWAIGCGRSARAASKCISAQTQKTFRCPRFASLWRSVTNASEPTGKVRGRGGGTSVFQGGANAANNIGAICCFLWFDRLGPSPLKNVQIWTKSPYGG